MNNKNLFRNIAGACFCFLAIWKAFGMIAGFTWITSPLDFFYPIILILLGIGLFTKSKILIMISSIVAAVYNASYIFRMSALLGIPLSQMAASSYIINIGYALSFLILAFAVTQNNISHVLGIVAAVFYVINVFFIRINLPTILTFIPSIAGCVMTGLAFSNKLVEQVNHTGSKQIAENSDSKIEKLSKLKELLDRGIITQEEFDEKKKQLLGL